MLILIETESLLCERISKDFAKRNPIAGVATEITYNRPAEIQLAGLYESIYAYLAPIDWKLMLQAGVGFVAGVIVKEEVKNAYQWLKCLFKEACSKQKSISTGNEKQGVELRIRSATKEGEQSPGFVVIKYRGVPSADGVMPSFDETSFEEGFSKFEIEVQPIIAHWSKQGIITQIIVEGFIGAGHSEPGWNLRIETSGATTPILVHVA